MAEPIRIIITQGGTGGIGLTGGQPSITPTGRDTKSGTEGEDLINNAGIDKKTTAMLTAATIAGIKRTITNGINNHASRTGSYMQQTKINDEISFGMAIAGIGMAFYTGGPLAGGLAIVNFGAGLVQQSIAFDINASKENYQAARTRERAGSSLGNGSRGTNE